MALEPGGVGAWWRWSLVALEPGGVGGWWRWSLVALEPDGVGAWWHWSLVALEAWTRWRRVGEAVTIWRVGALTHCGAVLVARRASPKAARRHLGMSVCRRRRSAGLQRVEFVGLLGFAFELVVRVL